MSDIDLSGPSAFVACLSAACWFYSATSVSREKELKRRNKLAEAKGEVPNLGGAEIVDGNQRYDLIATLRHQARWSKWGALLAAIALILQAADRYV